jgi:WD40 repeat protein
MKNYVAGSLVILYGHTNSVTSVSYSPDGQTLASASYDQTMQLWNAKTAQKLRVLTGHTSWVMSVSYSPDGRTLVGSGPLA